MGCPLRVRGPGKLSPLPPIDLALSAGAFTNQHESPLDMEGCNLTNFK